MAKITCTTRVTCHLTHTLWCRPPDGFARQPRENLPILSQLHLQEQLWAKHCVCMRASGLDSDSTGATGGKEASFQPPTPDTTFRLLVLAEQRYGRSRRSSLSVSAHVKRLTEEGGKGLPTVQSVLYPSTSFNLQATIVPLVESLSPSAMSPLCPASHATNPSSNKHLMRQATCGCG